MHAGPENDLLEQLSPLRGTRVVIVCIGNRLKGDDAAGPKLADMLLGKIGADVIDAATVPENYLQRIRKLAPQHLLIVDATELGAPAGTIRLLSPDQLAAAVISTHYLSPHLFIELLCKDSGTQAHFIAIQPAQTALCAGLSPPVADAVHRLATILLQLFPSPSHSS